MSIGVESVSGLTWGASHGGGIPVFGGGALNTIDSCLIESFGAACLCLDVAVGVTSGDDRYGADDD